jgi:hypothetical protein
MSALRQLLPSVRRPASLRRLPLHLVALLALCAWALVETVALWRTRRLRRLDGRLDGRSDIRPHLR